jgi:small multidrug resistance family-3 protein
MAELKTVILFLVTAVAEIVGCYLPYLWLREGRSAWLVVPAALSLALFAWLLSLHPTAAGRVYAAYGGIYISVAILWLWSVDGIRPTVWDLVGAVVALTGMAIIMFAPRPVCFERQSRRGDARRVDVTEANESAVFVLPENNMLL